MFEDLNGKTALVTGASSEGFGAHFAHLLSQNGVEVIVAARRLESLEALVENIRARGGRARAARLDVTDGEAVRTTVEAVGKIDILINNAGISGISAVLEQSEAQYDLVLDTNLKGAWLVATTVARAMRAAGIGGSIVNIASILASRQMAGACAYGMSKAGVIQMTHYLGLELARFKIRVNALAPGFFETDINREFLQSEAGIALQRRIALRRFGDFAELDAPLLLLASEASRFMTGSVITVDGGHSLMSL